MNKTAKILTKLLNLLEARLKQTDFWQVACPEAKAFNSATPFCMDTMNLAQWLRYVFLPRMRALIDADKNLPSHCSMTEQLEMVFTTNEKTRIMEVTLAIDQLLTEKKTPPARLLKQAY
ncbi:MAG TPA: YqcC family protein [Marinospirillum sp.]|uniref:YqcC family protein n=1 Tax=Marinospirillum sp. TaxID=2183934 RepID=UPI002B46FA97|nr:YqcC family protein [Marinospirillum sp.]HKM15870.1 YqcC family protein [Marinospirillum sp.]